MNYLSFIENKIVREKETLIHTLSQWRFKEEKIVLNTKNNIKKEKKDEEELVDVYYQVDIKGEVINPGIYSV